MRTNVHIKDILRMWWDLKGFYPSALIYHIFTKKLGAKLCQHIPMGLACLLVPAQYGVPVH